MEVEYAIKRSDVDTKIDISPVVNTGDLIYGLSGTTTGVTNSTQTDNLQGSSVEGDFVVNGRVLVRENSIVQAIIGNIEITS